MQLLPYYVATPLPVHLLGGISAREFHGSTRRGVFSQLQSRMVVKVRCEVGPFLLQIDVAADVAWWKNLSVRCRITPRV